VTETTGRELPGRAPGLHLSDKGREQAEAAAARLAGFTGRGSARNGKRPPAVAVYASPLERTVETATPIAAALGCDLQQEEGLLELDMGEWTGLELATARKRKEWSTIQRYPSSFRFPGGESFLDMQARMVGTVDRLRAAHAGQVVVAVSHADPIRALVAHAMGTHLDLFQRIVVSPCSLTGIAYGSEGPVVLMVNATDDARALVPS
jgi:probable phosphoglycerate mutase